MAEVLLKKSPIVRNPQCSGISGKRIYSGISHLTPVKHFLLTLLLFQAILLPNIVVQAQEYLSICDYSDSKPSCSSDKFLLCLSSRCQCADEVNHIYDFALDSCVIMTGRKCVDPSSIKLGSSYVIDLDPRQLESGSKSFPASPTFPTCGNQAYCDLTSFTCACTLGYFYNERNGQCELSLGKSCTPEATTLPLNETGSVLTQLPYSPSSSSTNLLGCDSSVGLRCGKEGICKCQDDSVWQIDLGCVSLALAMTSTTEKSLNNDDRAVITGNRFNSQPNSNAIFYNGDDSGLTPFQKLVNSYTKLLIDANNHYYLTHNDTEQQPPAAGMTTTDVEISDKIVFSRDPSKENSTRGIILQKRNDSNGFVGDRNQFPSGQGQTNPIWNLMLQQQQQQTTANSNSISYNGSGIGGGITGMAKLQAQANQLQKLLIQQQQLQNLIDQLNDQQSTGNGFPNPSSLIAPQNNNYLGAGSNQNFQQQSPAPPQQYPFVQQQQPTQSQGNNQFGNFFGGPFPLVRAFKNMIDPIKRSVFPNLADAVRSLPSPLHIAASTVNNFLPVLRTIDKQFSPMLQNFVELTRPRQRAHTLPHYFNQGNNQYPQNSFSNNNPFYQQTQQQGNPNFGNRNYGPGKSAAVVNARNGRMRNGNNQNRIINENSNYSNGYSLGRRLWWL